MRRSAALAADASGKEGAVSRVWLIPPQMNAEPTAPVEGPGPGAGDVEYGMGSFRFSLQWIVLEAYATDHPANPVTLRRVCNKAADAIRNESQCAR